MSPKLTGGVRVRKTESISCLNLIGSINRVLADNLCFHLEVFTTSYLVGRRVPSKSDVCTADCVTEIIERDAALLLKVLLC